MMKKWWICFVCITLVVTMAFAQTREEKLANLLKRFPQADTNQDGTLTMEEAKAFQNKQRREKRKKVTIPPTRADVIYGFHPNNVLDLWLVPSDTPTPLLVFIHGGGFRGGDKRNFDNSLIENMHKEGISVASINYRLTKEGLLKEGKNMYPAPMHDGARALQFLRYNASKYNLDKTKFAATGGSAGGCMLMWLGFHPDLAQADHKDPVLRESSRLQVLAPRGGQSCVHGPTLLKWFGVNSLNLSKQKGTVQSSSEVKQPTAKQLALGLDASPITHLTPDDPPIYLFYNGANEPVNEETTWGTWVHHPMFGIKLKEAMEVYLGMECHLEYKDGPPVTEYESQQDFIIRKLKSLSKDAIKGDPQSGADGATVLTEEDAEAMKWKTTGFKQSNTMGGGQAAISKSGTFRVFVLMGQSNMQGTGRAKELKAPYNEKHDRIRLWANGRWEYFVPSQRFGPGVSMAHQLAEFWPDDTIGIIKVAVGGTGICGFEKNWSFERAELTWDGKKGPLYKDLMNAVAEAKRISKPEFCGFVWKQGAADGTRKDLANAYYDRFKQLIADLRADLGVSDLPTFVPVYMKDEELLKVLLSKMNEKDVLKAKRSASTPPENDGELLKILLSYINDLDLPEAKKLGGRRPYIATVINAQNRAGREIPNVTTLYPGKLPVGDDGTHYSSEGYIKLGKITASAVEAFYKANK